MVATITDPRIAALCERRALLMDVVAMQRRAFKALCGCPRCGDAETRKQLADAIYHNAQDISYFTDMICDAR
jgi:hypothetical protein